MPTSIDHAIFDLPNPNPGVGVLVQAGNVGVGNLSILGMPVVLRGVVQVLNSGIGFETGQSGGFGGTLQLDSGSTLLTSDGVIGSRTGNSPTAPTVNIFGQGTRWTIGPSQPLQIGFLEPAFVVVDQGGLLNAQKEIDVGTLDVRGHLEVHTNALVTTPTLNV